MNRRQVILLLAAIASIAFWAVPGLRLGTLPLIYLNTHFHELAHAVVAVLSGGWPRHILVYADGGGVTPVSGGNPVLVASAGYAGTAVIGALAIACSRTPHGAVRTLKVLGLALLISLILLVRGDGVGMASGVGWVVVLFLLGHFLKGEKVQFAAQFIGIQLCLTAMLAFYSLIGVISFGGDSDASILAGMTGIPAGVWVAGWALISGIALTSSLRQAWSGHRSRRTRPHGS